MISGEVSGVMCECTDCQRLNKIYADAKRRGEELERLQVKGNWGNKK